MTTGKAGAVQISAPAPLGVPPGHGGPATIRIYHAQRSHPGRACQNGPLLSPFLVLSFGRGCSHLLLFSLFVLLNVHEDEHARRPDDGTENTTAWGRGRKLIALR